jgi:hypothetical protein
MDTEYMSSSRYVKAAIKEGIAFDKQILATFPTRKAAVAHEVELHNTNDVDASPFFFNQAKQTSTGFDFNAKNLDPEAYEALCKKFSEVQKIVQNRPEVAAKRGAAISDAYWALSPEKRAEWSANRRAASNAFWANISQEEKAERAAKSGLGMRVAYWEFSPEKRAGWRANIGTGGRRYWENISPESYEAFCNKMSSVAKIVGSRPEVAAKRSATLKKMQREIQNRPDVAEKKSASMTAAHRATSSKKRADWNANISAGHSAFWANISKENKAQLVERRREGLKKAYADPVKKQEIQSKKWITSQRTKLRKQMGIVYNNVKVQAA